MLFDLVIFDCDGVLVDTEKITDRCMSEALIELGLWKSREDVHHAYIGMTWADVIAKLEDELGRPTPEGWVAALIAREQEAFQRELRPIPGARAAVAAVADAGIPICVASSGSLNKMNLTLGSTGLLPHFEGRLFSAESVARGKPHPDIFLFAAEKMGAAPERCAVIEDSVRGVEGAAAAGMTAFGYAGDPLTDPHRLRAAGATVFENMAALPRLLGISDS